MINAEAARVLAGLLAETSPLWRPAPFIDDPAWVNSTPALAGALLALTDDQVSQFEANPEDLQHWIGTQVPALAAVCAAADACVDRVALPTPLDESERQGRDVPGRKWQQLLYFAAACQPTHNPRPGHLVEWCSGKAHLGRLLSRQYSLPVTAIEWSAALCRDGARLAQRDAVAVTFLQADVLHIDAPATTLTGQAHAVALHACGDLHVALLEKASASATAAIDIAPCCYHLMRAAAWQPLSAALQDCALAQQSLSRSELRLAVQETVTASARLVRQQRELTAWRLGFDCLQRDLRGADNYLPTPSRTARVLAGGFAAFCADLAAHHQLDLPAGIDFDRYARLGRERLARVTRLDLLRHACRRALEILLVADRALFLAESGYEVRIRRFCPRTLTPRNLLIQARRQDGR